MFVYIHCTCCTGLVLAHKTRSRRDRGISNYEGVRWTNRCTACGRRWPSPHPGFQAHRKTNQLQPVPGGKP